MLSSVDLPQPEWPMIETYSPALDVEVDVAQHLGRHLTPPRVKPCRYGRA
jgi:hypothetical protein